MSDTIRIIPRLLRRRAERYEYAINTENPAPGSDPDVIGDGDIIAFTQAQLPEEVLA